MNIDELRTKIRRETNPDSTIKPNYNFFDCEDILRGHVTIDVYEEKTSNETYHVVSVVSSPQNPFEVLSILTHTISSIIAEYNLDKQETLEIINEAIESIDDDEYYQPISPDFSNPFEVDKK